jgi:hypothetical protein
MTFVASPDGLPWPSSTNVPWHAMARPLEERIGEWCLVYGLVLEYTPAIKHGNGKSTMNR